MCHPDSAAAARLIIDLDAIASNWAYLGARAATAQCAAVVKADAYGLGMVPVARRLHRAGCRHFFVALLEEGLQLRASIPGNSHIYVLNGLVPGSEGLCARAGLIPVLNSLEQLAAWRDEAGRQGRRLPAVLQSDTGMRRLGLAERDWQSLVKLPALTAGLDIRLVMSHLVSAELPDAPINAVAGMKRDAMPSPTRKGGGVPPRPLVRTPPTMHPIAPPLFWGGVCALPCALPSHPTLPFSFFCPLLTGANPGASKSCPPRSRCDLVPVPGEPFRVPLPTIPPTFCSFPVGCQSLLRATLTRHLASSPSRLMPPSRADSRASLEPGSD